MRCARLAVAAVLLLAPACGGGASDVSQAAAVRLQPQVQALREAAASGSVDAANHELTDLRRLVGELSSTGELGEEGASHILDAAERVEANLSLLATTTSTTSTTTTTTTTTAPPPPPPPPDKEDDRGEEEEEEEEVEEDPATTDGGDDKPGKGNGGPGKD
jgi:hypothetical protein